MIPELKTRIERILSAIGSNKAPRFDDIDLLVIWIYCYFAPNYQELYEQLWAYKETLSGTPGYRIPNWVLHSKAVSEDLTRWIQELEAGKLNKYN